MERVSGNKSAHQGSDFAVIGRHLRDLRIVRGLTQREVARLADVALSTVFHVERGNPVRHGSIVKVCVGLGTTFDDVRRRNASTRSPDSPHIVHRAATTVWRTPVDRRKNVPPDHAERIADPHERLRLGKLGLVPIFAGYLNLLMPDGPGAMLVELYDRYSTPLNHTIYRESMLQCQEGGVRLQIGESVCELAPGDFVGYASEDLRWIEPLGTLPSAVPALLTWTGAVRVGKALSPGRKRTAVRKPKETAGKS